MKWEFHKVCESIYPYGFAKNCLFQATSLKENGAHPDKSIDDDKTNEVLIKA